VNSLWYILKYFWHCSKNKQRFTSFEESFEGINLQNKQITKAEFNDCVFKSYNFRETFFIPSETQTNARA